MTDVGQREIATQRRCVSALTAQLGYESLGNLRHRDNDNVFEERLRSWLLSRGHQPEHVKRAIDGLQHAKRVGGGRDLHTANKETYELLRYGVPVRVDVTEKHTTVPLIDWDDSEANEFAVAEEVTVVGEHTKRPDLVLYVNGIALATIELKRSTVALAEGIRQTILNQRRDFIAPYFSTVQLVMAGNDTEGLRYAVTGTAEQHWLEWKEDSDGEGRLDVGLHHLCSKARLLELVHDFIVFDAGTKKIARHNQYFGVKAAQRRVLDREGGIIWHTQGSGKSLTMVWLAKWIREHQPSTNVLVITDREELDEQIEGVFTDVDEPVYRTTSGADLLAQLRHGTEWLVCSLVHKAGSGRDEDDYAEQLRQGAAAGDGATGDWVVFVDECHRTQSGVLHRALRDLLPGATFIGFTGTPLLKADKARSIEVFGSYIHTYKFDEAVADGVVLDLRYEARDIDQRLTSPEKVDAWFESKTRGLSGAARRELMRRWGTLQKVLTAQSRLHKIVADVLFDMATKDRLLSGRGNALLVCSSIYEACKFYEEFSRTDLKGKCGIVTSYEPTAATIRDEEAGTGETEALEKYHVYRRLLAEHFEVDEAEAVTRADEYEDEVKRLFVEQPGRMKLLIVVDKLLTGFDAPPATYLYIDKQMRDHGLFQAICRVNRLDGDDKEYGHVIDYQDLFRSLEGAVRDYTSGAFDAYDVSDVEGLIDNRLDKARERLDEAREAVKALCEPVGRKPRTADYLSYFCAADAGNADQLAANEPKRLKLYKLVSAYLRAYADLANEMAEAGYSSEESARIATEVTHYEHVRREVKLASGDYVDLKAYEPAMRHLLDAYIEAEDSTSLSAFDDKGLVQLIVERGVDAVDELPEGIRQDEETAAEAIVNNVRKVIIDERPANPRYYDQMSQLLDEVIAERRRRAIDYQAYLQRLTQIATEAVRPGGTSYPTGIDTPARRALYDNLGNDDTLALRVDETVHRTRLDSWRGHQMKERQLRKAIARELPAEYDANDVFEIVKAQNEY